jgi:hypothetical protein
MSIKWGNWTDTVGRLSRHGGEIAPVSTKIVHFYKKIIEDRYKIMIINRYSLGTK